LINKLIKKYMEEQEELWIEDNLELYESGKWSVGDRRVLCTHWIAHAFRRVHEEHKDAIIKCFKSVGLSLPVDGSEDYHLNVRDLPNLTIGDWQKAPEGTKENPTIINDTLDTIEVDSNEDGLLYIAKEVVERVIIKQEDEMDVTTDSGVDSNERFDADIEGEDEGGESDFDDQVDGDEDFGDENM
jgi:hypothetical protein